MYAVFLCYLTAKYTYNPQLNKLCGKKKKAEIHTLINFTARDYDHSLCGMCVTYNGYCKQSYIVANWLEVFVHTIHIFISLLTFMDPRA